LDTAAWNFVFDRKFKLSYPYLSIISQASEMAQNAGRLKELFLSAASHILHM
jgi:hypothetical protein